MTGNHLTPRVFVAKELRRAVWEALRVEALPGKQSVDLLAEVAKTWT
ncbi:hypothetical protein AB0L00_40275 [Actinoallomurus sp. NPDC052308]